MKTFILILTLQAFNEGGVTSFEIVGERDYCEHVGEMWHKSLTNDQDSSYICVPKHVNANKEFNK